MVGRQQVRPILATTILLAAAPALAQSPEGQAYYDLNKCIEAAAERYAPLNGSLSDIADAAVAACRDEYAALDRAVDDSPQAIVKASFLSDIRHTIRQRAIEVIAEARLAAGD